MKNTKTNVIKLFKEMEEIARTKFKAFQRDGNEKLQEYYLGRYITFNQVINLLTDEEYFNEINDLELYKK